MRLCAPELRTAAALCVSGACPECSQPSARLRGLLSAVEASPSRPAALPQSSKRRDLVGVANPLRSHHVTLAGKEDVWVQTWVRVWDKAGPERRACEHGPAESQGG